jgi:uncharacterized protein YdaU (DUF1376 family)
VIVNYYPHYIKDFNNDTRHLTRNERSIYRDAIELYYETESPLIGDVGKLSRKLLVRSEDEMIGLTSILEEFFKLIGGVYIHHRCEEEILRYRGITTARAKAGKASAKARAERKVGRLMSDKANNSTSGEQVFDSVGAKSEQNPTNQEPRTKNLKPVKTLVEPKRDDSEFELIWSTYEYKGNRKTSLSKFKKINKSDMELLKVHLPKYVESTPDKQYRKDFESYIEKECWNDEITVASSASFQSAQSAYQDFPS